MPERLGSAAALPAVDEFHAPRYGLRYAYIAFGCLNVAVGVIGIVIPGMPTTVFLLVALWAFSKSSERFRNWLFNHKTLGPPVRDWHEHGAIPLKAKVLAVFTMSVSLVVLEVAASDSSMVPLIVGAIMIPIAVFVVTRPSRPALRTSH